MNEHMRTKRKIPAKPEEPELEDYSDAEFDTEELELSMV